MGKKGSSYGGFREPDKQIVERHECDTDGEGWFVDREEPMLEVT
jgi:hypothetical protein